LHGVLTDPNRCGYPDSQVRLLAGGTERLPDRKSILDGLDELAGLCARDQQSVAIVFYSGHGLFQDIEKYYYFVPHGFDPDRIRDTAVLGSEFATKVGAIGAKGLLVLLDCCHAGGLAPKGQVAKGLVRRLSMPPDLTALNGMSGRAVLASCRNNELSYVPDGETHSVFTAALLEGLAGYGARVRDGKAYFLDVLDWIGTQVPRLSAAAPSGQQNPVLICQDWPLRFPLAFYAGGDLQPKSLPGHGPVSPPDIGAPTLPPARQRLPDSFRDIEALGRLEPGEFDTVVSTLVIDRSLLAGSQLEKANVVYRKVVQGRKLDQLRALILLFHPGAFDDPNDG
jgi:hypothetical protein